MTAPGAGSGRTLGKGVRYLGASIGPVYSAGAQFLLWLVLLHGLDQREFGAFSLLLIASQLSAALWSALFCAPLPILFHACSGEERERLLTCLFSTNLVFAIFTILFFWLMALALDVPLAAAMLFAIYACISLLRGFARAHAYVSDAPLRTIASDNVYATVLMVGVGLCLLYGQSSLLLAYGSLLAGAVIGLLPFGRAYFKRQFAAFSPSSVRSYSAIWKRHSGWSLVGVIAVEATANAHAYIVTGLLGPAGFAPLAASALVTRPINVALNALAEFERAQMARFLGQERIAEARAAMRYFQLTMIGAWVIAMVAGGALLMIAPHLLFPRKYDLGFLVVAAALWMLVSFVRLWRTPVSTMLQAAGAFRTLAIASIYSAGVSIVTVVALLLLQGPLWSIVGIFIGELTFALICLARLPTVAPRPQRARV